MSNLSEYDRKIVQIAEEYVDRPSYTGFIALQRAVQAKQEAPRPPCDYIGELGKCRKPAVQRVVWPRLTTADSYRCADHGVQVTDL